MANYFRITAYHIEQDISAILDSNGRFEKLWQFSSFLVNKGFKIIEVTTSDKLVYLQAVHLPTKECGFCRFSRK